MTSNTPGVPSGGKVKLLWKGTALNSLCDKPAQAYWSQQVSMSDHSIFDLTDETISLLILQQLWSQTFQRFCVFMQIKYIIYNPLTQPDKLQML